MEFVKFRENITRFQLINFNLKKFMTNRDNSKFLEKLPKSNIFWINLGKFGIFYESSSEFNRNCTNLLKISQIIEKFTPEEHFSLFIMVVQRWQKILFLSFVIKMFYHKIVSVLQFPVKQRLTSHFFREVQSKAENLDFCCCSHL